MSSLYSSSYQLHAILQLLSETHQELTCRAILSPAVHQLH